MGALKLIAGVALISFTALYVLPMTIRLVSSTQDVAHQVGDCSVRVHEGLVVGLFHAVLSSRHRLRDGIIASCLSSVLLAERSEPKTIHRFAMGMRRYCPLLLSVPFSLKEIKHAADIVGSVLAGPFTVALLSRHTAVCEGFELPRLTLRERLFLVIPSGRYIGPCAAEELATFDPSNTTRALRFVGGLQFRYHLRAFRSQAGVHRWTHCG